MRRQRIARQSSQRDGSHIVQSHPSLRASERTHPQPPSQPHPHGPVESGGEPAEADAETNKRPIFSQIVQLFFFLLVWDRRKSRDSPLLFVFSSLSLFSFTCPSIALSQPSPSARLHPPACATQQNKQEDSCCRLINSSAVLSRRLRPLATQQPILSPLSSASDSPLRMSHDSKAAGTHAAVTKVGRGGSRERDGIGPSSETQLGS